MDHALAKRRLEDSLKIRQQLLEQQHQATSFGGSCRETVTGVRSSLPVKPPTARRKSSSTRGKTGMVIIATDGTLLLLLLLVLLLLSGYVDDDGDTEWW